MASPVIELRNVSLSFRSRERTETLFKNISLQVDRGESFVLMGPSGMGKSSLLKLMAGLLVPSDGDVLIEGQNLQSMRRPEREAIARKTGMLFQKNALFDSLTIAENVAFPMREVLKSSESEIESAVCLYLDAVGLLPSRALFPDEISGGMQKRLGIARALALKPEIIFYDDPTAGLDPITSRKIVDLILRLQEEMGTTLVAVTNDMHRARQLADRIGMVVDGELVVCGTPDETWKSADPRVRQFISGSLEGPLMVLQ